MSAFLSVLFFTSPPPHPQYNTPLFFRVLSLSNHVYFHPFTRFFSNPLCFKRKTRLPYARFTALGWLSLLFTFSRDIWSLVILSGPVCSWNLDPRNTLFSPTWAAQDRLQITTPCARALGQYPTFRRTWIILRSYQIVSVTHPSDGSDGPRGSWREEGAGQQDEGSGTADRKTEGDGLWAEG